MAQRAKVRLHIPHRITKVVAVVVGFFCVFFCLFFVFVCCFVLFLLVGRGEWGRQLSRSNHVGFRYVRCASDERIYLLRSVSATEYTYWQMKMSSCLVAEIYESVWATGTFL